MEVNKLVICSVSIEVVEGIPMLSLPNAPIADKDPKLLNIIKCVHKEFTNFITGLKIQ